MPSGDVIDAPERAHTPSESGFTVIISGHFLLATATPQRAAEELHTMSTPTEMVVDRPGLDRLVAAVADEEYYAFDTEFHTERTYVPDLALIQVAWADKVAMVDPLAVDPAPLATIFNGPGTAVAHAAFQDLDVLQAACGAVPSTSSIPRSPPASSACRRRRCPAWSTSCSALRCPRPTGSRTGWRDRSATARSPTP